MTRREVGMPESTEEPTEYPSGIGTTARRALALTGLTTCDQLTRVSEADLEALHGIGPKALRILRESLAERGQSFLGSA